jgi:hypothetical protein
MTYVNYLLEFNRVGYRGTHARRDERRRHRNSTVLQRAAGRLGLKIARAILILNVYVAAP